MMRCMDCHATMKSDELQCWACGSAVVKKETPRSLFARRFATGLKFATIGSGILTVASLFFDATPSFTRCITATIVLLLAKSSAEQMIEKKS
jgi:DNA-directed RNA polymerase subunit RPC12/RpoP